MTKTPNMENWGRAKAKQRYADGGSVNDDMKTARAYMADVMSDRNPKARDASIAQQMNASRAISDRFRPETERSDISVDESDRTKIGRSMK